MLGFLTILTTATPTLNLGTIDTGLMIQIIYDFIPIGIPVMLLTMGIKLGVGIFRNMMGGGL